MPTVASRTYGRPRRHDRCPSHTRVGRRYELVAATRDLRTVEVDPVTIEAEAPEERRRSWTPDVCALTEGVASLTRSVANQRWEHGD